LWWADACVGDNAGLFGWLACIDLELDHRRMPDKPLPSVFRPGGVTYLRIPCRNPSRAADFCETVFGWSPRRDSDEPAFSDATGHVIGHFIVAEPARARTGIPRIYRSSSWKVA
jgi:hypothetical protein